MAELSQEQAAISIAFLQKLVGLGIDAKLQRVEPGPVVTGYHFTLAHAVPLSKIMKKAEDFALAAACEKVTITRIGGEVVIFAANKNRRLVEFKDYMYWFCTDKEVAKMKIPIALGVDYHGNKAAFDLVDAPHVLLAGETGSGKSVLEAAILCSLTVARKPSQIRIHLVDTKQLDLPLFSKLPHINTVVTELKQYHKLMDALLNEHYRRAEKLKNMACRNIREYHGMMGEEKSMPFWLVMIDEFADLIEQDRAAKKAGDEELEALPNADKWLQRIAQVCRATGIHVIAGTQRSSVKIINGDIKANFPCRISLRLPTEADSRTILGQQGAENLLGKGDMLVQRADSEVLKRYHGPFVDLTDIGTIIDQEEILRDQFAAARGVSVEE